MRMMTHSGDETCRQPNQCLHEREVQSNCSLTCRHSSSFSKRRKQVCSNLLSGRTRIMGASIKISLSSDIPAIKMKDVELEVEQRKLGMSWKALLVERRHRFDFHLSLIDVETMMIRSTGRNFMTALNEPIRKFLAQYKKKVKTYRVQIVKPNCRTKNRLVVRRQVFKREIQEGRPTSVAGTAAPAPPLPPPPAGRVGQIRRPKKPEAAALGRKKVKFNLPGPSSYPEDALDFPPSVPAAGVGAVEEENDMDMPDFDNDASLCSQDSQDPGIDLKSGAFQRFQQNASDADILQITNELKALSRNNKVLKVSRYIPHSVTLLNLIFLPQADA